MLKFVLGTVAVAASIYCGDLARGNLVLNIDTATEEFFFTGNLQATAGPSNNGIVRWEAGSDGSNTALSPPASVFDAVGQSPVPSILSMQLASTGTVFVMAFPGSSGAAVNLDGSSERVKYDLAEPAQKLQFESLIGSSLINNINFGSAPAISVQGVAAVPEPSAFLAVGLLSIGMSTRRTMWRRFGK